MKVTKHNIKNIMKNNITNNYQNNVNLKKYKSISLWPVSCWYLYVNKKDVTDDVFTGCNKKYAAFTWK